MQNGIFVPYLTTTKHSVAFLSRGIRTHDEMLAMQRSYNNLTTWIIRFAGFAMMYIGLSIMTRIVVTLGKKIPFSTLKRCGYVQPKVGICYMY